MIPPNLSELLAEPRYRQYLKKIPTPTPCTSGFPWQVWAVRRSGKWGSRLCETYQDAYRATLDLYRSHSFQDICITSRSRIFPEPGKWVVKGFGKDAHRVFVPTLRFWSPQFEWCGRCRRPTRFRYCPEGHRALRDAPILTSDDPYRCYYCGARRSLAGV